MREIKYIVIHTSATPQSATVPAILRYWREVRGWRSPGYHYIIDGGGQIHDIWPIDKISNGVTGFNKESIHVCYIGGVDRRNKPIDNRSPAQKKSMVKIISELVAKFPKAEVLGHRDFPNVRKDCPCFDAREWWSKVNKDISK